MQTGKRQREADHAIAGERAEYLPAGFGRDYEERQRGEVGVGAGPDGALNIEASPELGESVAMPDDDFFRGAIGCPPPPSFFVSVHSKAIYGRFFVSVHSKGTYRENMHHSRAYTHL